MHDFINSKTKIIFSPIQNEIMMRSTLFFLTFLSCLFSPTQSQAQDWPNLKRFQEANQALTTPDPMNNRIVFMGNSITEGWKRVRPSFFKDHPFINRGISGQTTPQMLIRFRQDVIELRPKAVVILAGINDIAGNTGPMTLAQTANNIFSMAELATANNIKVYLCSVLPAFDFPWSPGKEPAQKVIELNAKIKAYAIKNGHHYVDYFTVMADDRQGLPKELAQDGIHPTNKGYEIMEPILLNALNATGIYKKQ